MDYQHMTEQEAQIKIIEYFLHAFKGLDIIVALEVPFCEYKRRADIVFVVNGFTYAVEIKTEKDKVNTLENQISDYKKIFDFCYIAAEGKNFTSIIKRNYGNVGILKIEHKVKKHREARIVKTLDKKSLLSCMDFSYLKKHSSFVVMPTKQESILESVKKMKIVECRMAFLEFMKTRYQHGSASFFHEIGSTIHTDDLLILSKFGSNIS